MILKLTQQQIYQLRTSPFAVGILGKVVRLFPWDRSGCQVSVPIDYSTEERNHQLAEFFLRIDRIVDDPEARGWDLTVKDATVEEVEEFAEVVKAVCEGRLKLGQRMARGEFGLTHLSVTCHVPRSVILQIEHIYTRRFLSCHYYPPLPNDEGGIPAHIPQ
jgi:hypothetical protein